MTIQRQLRWNVKSEENPTRQTFYFLIVGDNRLINRIKQRTKEQLQPTEDMQTLAGGVKRKSRYELVQFISYRKESPNGINWEKIYKGKIVRDEELYERNSTAALETFVESHVKKLP